MKNKPRKAKENKMFQYNDISSNDSFHLNPTDTIEECITAHIAARNYTHEFKIYKRRIDSSCPRLAGVYHYDKEQNKVRKVR